ncbi:uncharacterized protein LY79DRAFT_160054 [Colletotrichum navitas]|uniref:Uncharacterized protein n=1 Tax=Colletotrichum navitas TaxID=681940 RepID=A0AAD8V4M7_9PEZI|nr:uncharacterized protein LY79DRAFT_160054 [Colletotrichum navitas]KAK1594122.1 hypothetical protein LY79DRAFT_160054 [Colletotrichum navitas]
MTDMRLADKVESRLTKPENKGLFDWDTIVENDARSTDCISRWTHSRVFALIRFHDYTIKIKVRYSVTYLRYKIETTLLSGCGQSVTRLIEKIVPPLEHMLELVAKCCRKAFFVAAIRVLIYGPGLTVTVPKKEKERKNDRETIPRELGTRNRI